MNCHGSDNCHGIVALDHKPVPVTLSTFVYIDVFFETFVYVDVFFETFVNTDIN